MQCVVPGCGNNSSRTSQGVTFFMFPLNPLLRAAWLGALHKEGWEPEKHSAVCSKHFVKGDLLVSSSGEGILQPGALPVVDLQNVFTTNNSMAPCEVKVCRICFATNCKLYPMTGNTALCNAYETLTGLLLEQDDNLPPYLCIECSHELLKCARFKARSLQSHSILLEIVRKHKCVTLQSMQSILGLQRPPSSTLTNSQIYQYDLEMEFPEKRNVYPDNQADQKRHLPGSHKNFVVDGIKVENDDVTTQNFGKEDTDNKVSVDMTSSLGAIKIKTERDDTCNADIVRYDTNNGADVDISNTRRDIIVEVKAENCDLTNMDPLNEYATNDDMHQSSVFDTANDDLANPDTLNEYAISDDMVEVSVTDGVKAENMDVTNHGGFNEELANNNDSDGKAFGGEDCSLKNSLLLRRRNVKRKTKPSTARVQETTAVPEHLYQSIERWKQQADSGLLTNENLSCELCPYQTLSVIQLLSHLKAHAAPMSYKCEACNYRTISKENMTCHIRAHSGEKPYSCNMCKKPFNRKADLRQHMRIHTGEKPYSCGVCNRAFLRKPDLKKHARIHSGEKPYSCGVCNEAFSRKCYLQYHLSIHFGKQFICDICNKAFNRRDNLKDHLLTHSDKKPHTCDICKKGYVKKVHLQSHLLIHTGEKPYSCNFCDKAYTVKSDLQLHLLTHAGERRFLCNVCNKTFNRKCDLQRHSRTHTREKPYS